LIITGSPWILLVLLVKEVLV